MQSVKGDEESSSVRLLGYPPSQRSVSSTTTAANTSVTINTTKTHVNKRRRPVSDWGEAWSLSAIQHRGWNT